MEMNNVDLSTVLLGGAGLAAVYGLWDKIKAVFNYALGLFIVRVNLADRGHGSSALTIYILDNYKQVSWNSRLYYIFDTYVKPKFTYQYVGFKGLSNSTLFYKDRKFFWVTFSKDGSTDADITINFIRGFFDSDQFITDAIEYYNNIKKYSDRSRYYVRQIVGKSKANAMMYGNNPKAECSNPDGDNYKYFTPLKWNKDQLGLSKLDKNNYIPCSVEVQSVIEDCVNWKKDRQWYIDHGVTWTLGYLFTGKPGTGKTSLARTIAQKLDFPVIAFDLASLTNEELLDSWQEMLEESPCCVLIEDIDTVFEGRKNVSGKEDGITFDCLLNCLDGIRNSEGILKIITTNRRDCIDSAICSIKTDEESMQSRPGRIDKEVVFVNPTREHMVKFCRRILAEYEDRWDNVIEVGLRNSDTSCQFQSRCTQLARKLKNVTPEKSEVQEVQTN